MRLESKRVDVAKTRRGPGHSLDRDGTRGNKTAVCKWSAVAQGARTGSLSHHAGHHQTGGLQGGDKRVGHATSIGWVTAGVSILGDHWMSRCGGLAILNALGWHPRGVTFELLLSRIDVKRCLNVQVGCRCIKVGRRGNHITDAREGRLLLGWG